MCAQNFPRRFPPARELRRDVLNTSWALCAGEAQKILFLLSLFDRSGRVALGASRPVSGQAARFPDGLPETSVQSACAERASRTLTIITIFLVS